MREETHETLRSKDPTIEGRHLHEPDGFPHSMIGVLAFFILLFPVVVGMFYLAGGIGSALIGAGLLLFIGVPLLVSKFNRQVKSTRAVEEQEEHEVETAEAMGLPTPKTHMERANDVLNQTYDQRTHQPR